MEVKNTETLGIVIVAKALAQNVNSIQEFEKLIMHSSATVATELMDSLHENPLAALVMPRLIPDIAKKMSVATILALNATLTELVHLGVVSAEEARASKLPEATMQLVPDGLAVDDKLHARYRAPTITKGSTYTIVSAPDVEPDTVYPDSLGIIDDDGGFIPLKELFIRGLVGVALQ